MLSQQATVFALSQVELPQRLIKFKNCRILRNHTIIREDLWVRNGKIINPEKIFFDEKGQAHVQIDCHNAIISPGFIDLQINGGYGVDFSYDINSVEDGILKVSKKLLAHGVTSFCPTLVTSPKEIYHQVLPKIKRKAGGKHGATILGVHVEGPFISIEKKGAHPENCIRELENGFDTLEAVYGDISDVSIITLAPEKPRVPEVISELVRRGIIVSVGHSMADLIHGETAVKHGASLITHLFNAMMPFHHRDPGLVGLLASNEIPDGKTVYFGIITDGIHTHGAALRIAYRTHPKGLIIVTDAISAMGLEEGTHRIGQYSIEVRDHKAYVAGTNTLCGSIAPMDECIRVFLHETQCPIEFALEAASLHPATCLGISDRKGTLNYEADADFILLDDNLIVHSAWIAGTMIGPHRPLWAKYGEYVFLPPQRWLHNIEHGAIVLLYHPCSDAEQLEQFKKLVKNCLFRHVITPFTNLTVERPFALLGWSTSLEMSHYDEELSKNFIKYYARSGPEKMFRDGQYKQLLIEKAKVVTNVIDSEICPGL